MCSINEHIFFSFTFEVQIPVQTHWQIQSTILCTLLEGNECILHRWNDACLTPIQLWYCKLRTILRLLSIYCTHQLNNDLWVHFSAMVLNHKLSAMGQIKSNGRSTASTSFRVFLYDAHTVITGHFVSTVAAKVTWNLTFCQLRCN